MAFADAAAADDEDGGKIAHEMNWVEETARPEVGPYVLKMNQASASRRPTD